MGTLLVQATVVLESGLPSVIDASTGLHCAIELPSAGQFGIIANTLLCAVAVFLFQMIVPNDGDNDGNWTN